MASWKTEMTLEPMSGDGSVPESGVGSPGFSNKGPPPSLLCPQPASFNPGFVSSSSSQPASALSAPPPPHPPQGFQDLGPEFCSIFAQTKQEDGFNTVVPAVSFQMLWCPALPKQVDTYALPHPCPQPAPTWPCRTIGHKLSEEACKFLFPQTSAWMKSPHLKPGEASGSRTGLTLGPSLPTCCSRRL